MILDLLYLLSSVKSYFFLLVDFLQLLSSDKSDSLNDESDDDGSDSGSAGTCTFPFRFDDSLGRVYNSVGRVSGVGSGVFAPI